jgi:hypothetical protein
MTKIIKMYGIKNCDSVKKAQKFLKKMLLILSLLILELMALMKKPCKILLTK